jgi:hypothetical protein
MVKTYPVVVAAHLPVSSSNGAAVFVLNDGEVAYLTRLNDGSYYGATPHYDFAAKTAQEMTTKLNSYGAKPIGWEA